MERELELILKQKGEWWREQNRRMNEWVLRHRHEHPHFRYLHRIPMKAPKEFIIVHSYLTAKLQLGEPGYPRWRVLHQGGFRIWADEPHPDYVACNCGWAPHLEKHYRVDYERLLKEDV
jgi:hypothetical protein